MSKSETIICKLCSEPIFNYLCIDCLGNSVSRWIEREDKSFLDKFKTFHNSLKNHFLSFDEKEKCIKCKRPIEVVICPYCYTKEVIFLLSVNAKNLVELFKKFFNFDMGYSDNMKVKRWLPTMVGGEEEPDMNICEMCGNISEWLYKINGSYICESCRDEK
ncbi:MAG: hypothetical protein QMD14_04335 [Candidatus Aenigmarchaeota archaeon]|nr:hypothetical protein [Candidatus Aenigmarchaeota archaeon]